MIHSRILMVSCSLTVHQKSVGSFSVTNELQRTKAEKSAAISQRKRIDQELDKLKKIIPEKVCLWPHSCVQVIDVMLI